MAKRYSEQVRAGKRDYIADLLKFVNASKDRPPKTLHLYLAGIRQYLLFCCDIDLSTKERFMLRKRMPKGNRARTREDDLSRDKIRRILLHCDVRLKALILLLVSSGLRIGEALQLGLSDVTLDAIPPVVYVRGEAAKEGDYYISFLTGEAKEALQEWLKVRDSYIIDAARRTSKNISHSRGRHHKAWTKEPRPPSENSLFPWSYISTILAVKKVLKRAGLYAKDPTTRISTIHLHMFRKFFLSQVKAKGIPDAIAETLVGHSTYLSDAYRRYTTQQLAEEYRKAESALYIFQDSKPIEQLDERTKQFDEVMRRNNALVAELENIKSRVARWEAFTQRFMNMSNDQLTDLGRQVTQSDIVDLDREAAEAHAKEDEDRNRSRVKAAQVPNSPKRRASH